MAPLYIFIKSLRSAYPIVSRASCRNRFSVEGFSVADSPFLVQNQSFSTKGDDFTVSYLVNSCGLSPQAAIAIVVTHKLKLQSSEKSDSVLALLRDYEFSHTQISKVVRRHPKILMADPKRTLLPKLEFFCSIGLSRADLAKTLSYNPQPLSTSLKNCIVPAYTFVKRIVISDVRVLNILKHNSRIFLQDLSKNVLPNIGVLKELGMPQSCIALLLTYYANIVLRKPQLFSQLVGEVKEMGFNPEKSSFVAAMRALSGKKATWNRNQEALEKWGWSEKDILDAFRLFPLCMTKSQKKIMVTMDFLVNKMGWQSEMIAKCPKVLCRSLEMSIVPRFSVVRVLCLKGLIKEDNLSLASVITSSEKNFLNRFVTRYLDQVPQLWNVYRGKVDLLDAL